MSISLKRYAVKRWRDPVRFLALGFGAGCAPKIPGTLGTLAAIPLYCLLRNTSLPLFLLLIVLLFAVGVWLCGHTVRSLGVHDHPSIVWDEMVGYFITMIAAPSGWLWVVMGFVLFRLFDIAKPWPIQLADKRLAGGFGIMFDDALAGIYACLVMQILARLA